MKKMTMVVLMVVAVCFSLIGCSKEETVATPELQKWQEADIINEAKKEVEKRYKNIDAKVVSKGDIEIYHAQTSYTLDGLKAVHVYLGNITLYTKERGADKAETKAYFWRTYNEYLGDSPEIDMSTMTPIKKGDIRKRNGFVTMLFDNGKYPSKKEVEYKEEQKRYAIEALRNID